MNLILFNREEIVRPLPIADPRAVHILSVLRRQISQTFDAGLLNGPRGQGTLVEIKAEHLVIEYAWGDEPPPADPITLVIGLPRPQTARKILQEASTLGVAALHFVRTVRGESSYADSTLWRTGEWQRHIAAGAAQAFCTRVPTVSHGNSLSDTLALLPKSGDLIALDNYEASIPFSNCHLSSSSPSIIAFGAERGWSADERELLGQRGFIFSHLGSRVLRLETAVIVALALLKAQQGTM